jgi:hypothetical protein
LSRDRKKRAITASVIDEYTGWAAAEILCDPAAIPAAEWLAALSRT